MESDDPLGVKRFLARDWEAVARLKREYWAKLYQEKGSEAILDLVQAQYEHLRAMRPDWPTERDRAEDLAHHIRLKQLINKCDHVFVADR